MDCEIGIAIAVAAIELIIDHLHWDLFNRNVIRCNHPTR